MAGIATEKVDFQRPERWHCLIDGTQIETTLLDWVVWADTTEDRRFLKALDNTQEQTWQPVQFRKESCYMGILKSAHHWLYCILDQLKFPGGLQEEPHEKLIAVFKLWSDHGKSDWNASLSQI